MGYQDDLKWYAAFVEIGREDKVKQRLEYRFKRKLSFYVPKRGMKERKSGVLKITYRNLFPGYILINGDIQDNDVASFKNIPGLFKLLSSEGEVLTIPPNEISFINKLMLNGDVIGPSSLYTEGNHVKIIDGPLMGMEGYIDKIDKRKGRVKIKMSFLGEERIIDFSVNIIEKA